jgi:hypothetical protein
MPTDEQTGAPSTPEALDAAQDAALATNDFARYAEVENARESNKALPEAPPPSKETSDKTPASETGTEKEIQEKKPKTGEDRKAELKADIDKLLKQRAELRGETQVEKPGVKEAASPAAVEPAKAAPAAEPAKPAAVEVKAGEAPKAPSLADFETLAQWQTAQDKYVTDLVEFRLAASEQKRITEATMNARNAQFKTRVDAAKEEHADFAEVAFRATTPITPVMVGFLQDSDQEARLLYKLGENDSAEGKRISALTPYAQVRALIAIEDSLPTVGKKEAVTPPVKKHTAAPAPATSLGGNAEAVDDPVASLAANDFAAYAAKENAREKKAAANR